MNIFVLDKDPAVAARMMCDKHVVKMILESVQMLCTVARSKGHDDAPYRATHANHPCTKWVGHSRRNWEWLIEHTQALCQEYTRRYKKIHKCEAVLQWAKGLAIALPDTGLTPFALAMPDIYKVKDPVQSYRNYYLGDKSRFAKWKTGNVPGWWR